MVQRKTEFWMGATTRLLAMIWRSLSLGEVFPSNAFWSVVTRVWLRGAEMRRPVEMC